LQIGRIFASQKPGYPLQFGRFAAKFRFYPLRVSSSDAVFVINQRCPREAPIYSTGNKSVLLYCDFSPGINAGVFRRKTRKIIGNR
jgi:hypothetical protein